MMGGKWMDLRKELSPYAQEQGQLYGILPSFIMGVAWLETGAGKSTLCQKANNLFSIKGDYKGDFITMPTVEYIGGKKTTVNAKFRKYPTFRESVKDFCELIKNGVSWNRSVYSHAVIGKTNITDVVYSFAKTPYMTDPSYGSKMLAVIKSFKLTDFDSPAPVHVTSPVHTVYTSVVDFLKAHNMDSSFSNRTKLAQKYGLKDYHGTPAQNIALLRFLEGGH
jgi:flagellum-specific peptidoglycan hydrolase FlgJ